MTFKCIDVEQIYARDSKVKPEDVKILQEWLTKQPHLPKLKEIQVAAFLHSCYYRIEAAKITIDNYFTMRTHHPEIFNCLPEEALRKTLSTNFVNILPNLTPKKDVILMVKLLDFKVENFNFCNVVNVVNMVTTLHLHQSGMERGGVVIFDCSGFTLSHLTRFNITVLKHALDHVQEGAPVRIKGIHFINIVPIMDKVMALVKPLVKAELFGLLQLHSSMDTLYKLVPKECLPEDYGGEAPSCQLLKEQNLTNLLNNYDFFKWHDSQLVDESKRVGQCKGELFGIQGTFKKLQID